MEIILAENSGFCSGVRHAVNTAMNLNVENAYVLGEIIHNPNVVKAIREKGLVTVDSLNEVPDGATVVFRSHGVPEKYYGECERRGINVVDCTCSFVKRTQKIVKEQYALGKHIVIIGEPAHPEVTGLLGWCEDSATVVNDLTAITDYITKKELCVVCQTTFSAEKFAKIIENIKKVCEKTVAVFTTICYTTIARQKEVKNLSARCEAVLVIGGLNSSNTNKLYELAKKHCKNVFKLSSAESLDITKIKNFKSLGIVSGASTPDEQTREVLLKMAVNTEVKANPMDEALAEIDNKSKFKKGDKVSAIISNANDEGLQVLLPNTKAEVALNKEELDCEVYNAADYSKQIGDSIDLIVIGLNPVKLSQKKIKEIQQEEALTGEIEDGKEFSVVCTGCNKGGLTAQLGTYSVFVPAKEIRPGFVKDLAKYEGKTLRLRALEIKKSGARKEIIASQRVILQEERDARDAVRAAKEDEFFANITVGDVVEGKVERATNFGAFVSVGGFDCLAHITDLSWTGVSAVTDVLEIGKIYEFIILKIDKENKKVSIGYKQLQPQPWDLVDGKYNVGDVIHGKVVRIVPFGAFVEVEKGIDGLVHVSQITHERIETPATVLNVGDEVDAKIIAVDTEARKMNLSIKALLPEGEKKKHGNEENGEEATPKKGGRAPRRGVANDDELSTWNEGSIGGTSIADLLANAKKNK